MPSAVMTPHRRLARAIGALSVALAACLALSLPAGAADQEVLGLLGGSTSITTPPSVSVDFGGFAVGANNLAGGSITVQSNQPYTVTVVADRAALTSWDGSSYGDEALASALVVVPTLSGGSPVPVPAAVSTTPATLFTGLGLTTDSVTLQLQQAVLLSDLPGTYRSVLTYTASPTL